MTVSKWMTIARQCLLRRISVQTLGDMLRSYDGEIEGKRLFWALVDCRETFCLPEDPLVSLYIEHFATAGYLTLSDALLVLTQRWNTSSKERLTQDGLTAYNHTLQDLTMLITDISPRYKLETAESKLALYISSRWLSSLARVASREDATQPSNLEFGTTVESLAFFAATLAATNAGLDALSPGGASPKDEELGKSAKDLRASIRHAFELCLPLYAILSSQLMERINTVLKHINLLDDTPTQAGGSPSQAAEMQALQFQVSIAESQIVASKAGTMLFLGHLLLTGSTIDDGTAVNWLSTRHHNDYLSVFSDIFTTSFSILKSQSLATSKSRALCMQQCQLFIQNKLPALLSMISSASFNSFSTEQAIVEAWQQVGPLLSDQHLLSIGANFLHICSLVHLLPGSAAAKLVGNEDLLKGFSKGLYTKDVLVDQVTSNPARGPKLVEELIRADGSAGFISQAIVEIMHTYCQSKETQYLKDLANAIIRKPAAINCIALFIRPSFFLGPLCTLLDEWRWDEIHGEAQPVYDEFGAVFLLILVTRARLGLASSTEQLGIRKKHGFLSEYFKNETSEVSLDDLSEERKSHLGNWINALYLAEGLSDELFTNCSPHDFYPLIPTLLRQSVTANQQGKLSNESLKAGLDYLLEPFLLPSLMSALNWAGSIVENEPMVATKVLDVLTKAPGTLESRDIHHTILASCAQGLKTRLKALSATGGSNSNNNNLDSVVKVLDTCQDFTLSSEQDVAVLSTQNERGSAAGYLGALQQALVTLITTSGTSTASLDPEDPQASTGAVVFPDIPALTKRAIEVRGSDATVHALVEVLLQLSSASSQQFLCALDTIATAVCVCDAPGDDQLLRDALRVQYHTLGALLKTGNTLSAEAVVRLYRQVEAYTTLLTVQEMGLEGFNFGQQLANIDTANPNLDATGTGAGGAALSVSGGIDSLQVDQGQVDGIDQVLDEAAAMGNLESSDADLNFDNLYGLQGNDLDLNDLDLDMF